MTDNLNMAGMKKKSFCAYVDRCLENVWHRTYEVEENSKLFVHRM